MILRCSVCLRIGFIAAGNPLVVQIYADSLLLRKKKNISKNKILYNNYIFQVVKKQKQLAIAESNNLDKEREIEEILNSLYGVQGVHQQVQQGEGRAIVLLQFTFRLLN